VQNKAQDDDLVMSLVEMALARPADGRAAYLENACDHDSQLFDEVWKYVEWEERMKGFLLDPLVLPASERGFEPGELLDGRFRIVREVAQGGMGIVYEAVDERLERRIAIKCAKAGFRKRLPPEVRHAREIAHPNVCRIFEIHTVSTDHGEVDFLTMEFLDGETLAERLRRGPLPEIEARTIAQQLCAGLAEAHRNRVIHGDLKSNNVILATAADGAIRAVITDFGLAHGSQATQRTMQSGALGGTPDYMAPELWKGEKATVASDVYALGVILYELACGGKPYPSSPELPWEIRLTRRPEALKHRWRRTVDRCLDPDPTRRCASVAEIASAVAPSHTLRQWTMAAAAAIVAAVVGAVIYSNVTAPQENVRLAILPFETDAADRPLSDGLLDGTAEQLRQVKSERTRRLTVIPWADAVRNKVDKPEKAAGLLGATHILTGTLRRDGRSTLIHAYLTDAHSRLPLKEWQAEYQPSELRDMPVALAGMIIGTLRLPPLAAMATVSAAAYGDFARGVGLLQRNSVEEALPLLESAAKADPDSPLTHARLAEAQLLKYQLTKEIQWQQRAKVSLARAELRNPDLAVVRTVSGLINESGGVYESAEEDYQRALEIEPQNGDVWRRMGDLYQKASRFPQAVAAYQKAAELQPGYFLNYQAMCSLYADQANFEEAIRQCQRVVALVPQLAEAHYTLSKPYLADGHYAEGERELRVAVELDARSSNALHALALALVYQRRYWDAIPYFKRAIEIGPETEVLYLNFGTTLRLAGLPQDAKEAYSRGLTLAEAELTKNPRDRIVKSHLAYLCARLGQTSRAESEAGQAAQLSHGSVEVARMLVQTYEALGDRDRALALAETLPSEMLRRLNRSPDSADLPKDPRFQQLMLSHHIQ
jgi:tetratricopeptide (TPR) repeat protein